MGAAPSGERESRTANGRLRWAGVYPYDLGKGYFRTVYTCVCVRRHDQVLGIYSIAFGMSSTHEVCVVHDSVSRLQPVPDASSKTLDFSQALSEHIRKVLELPCCDNAEHVLALHTNTTGLTLCAPKWVKPDTWNANVILRDCTDGKRQTRVACFNEPWTPRLMGAKESPLRDLPNRTQLWSMSSDGRSAGEEIKQVELTCCLKWVVRLHWVLSSMDTGWDQSGVSLVVVPIKDLGKSGVTWET